MTHEVNDVHVDGIKQETKDEDSNAKETEDKQDDGIYSPPLPNKLVITMNPRRRYPRLSFFINRARKILRHDETLTITGVDKAISMACTLVELLQREKIAKVTKISTNMNLSPNFGGYNGNLAWGDPVPTILFEVKRGEYATCVSDYHQRKVIEIFENSDSQHTGKVEIKIIHDMNLPLVFSSTPEQKEEATKYLKKTGGSDINLPHFIHYCSFLIHPLLKDSVFKESLAKFNGEPETKKKE